MAIWKWLSPDLEEARRVFLSSQPETQEFLCAYMAFECDLRATTDPKGVKSARNTVGYYEEWQAKQQGRKKRATEAVLAHYRAVIAQWPNWNDLVFAFWAERIQEARSTIEYAHHHESLPPMGLSPTQSRAWMANHPPYRERHQAEDLVTETTGKLTFWEKHIAAQQQRPSRSTDELIIAYAPYPIVIRDVGEAFSDTARQKGTQLIMGMRNAIGIATEVVSVPTLAAEDVNAEAERSFSQHPCDVLLFFAKTERRFSAVVSGDTRRMSERYPQQKPPPKIEEWTKTVTARYMAQDDFDRALLESLACLTRVLPYRLPSRTAGA